MDPIQSINQAAPEQPIDTTSDIAGAANVAPSYIMSDIYPTDLLADSTTGVDNVSVSSGTTTTPLSEMTYSPITTSEPTGYIESYLAEPPVAVQNVIDNLSMNSIDEINAASDYIAPADPAITQMLSDLKQNWVIYDGMTESQLIKAISDYVAANITYTTETEGVDRWQSVAQTIQTKTGDCEDYANLLASLLVAALINRGVDPNVAAGRVNCIVTLDSDLITAHVFVKLTGADGTDTFINPTVGSISNVFDQAVLFSYTADSVDMVRTDFDFENFIASAYTVPFSGPNTVNALEALVKQTELQGWNVWLTLRHAMSATTVASAKAAWTAAESYLNLCAANWAYYASYHESWPQIAGQYFLSLGITTEALWWASPAGQAWTQWAADMGFDRPSTSDLLLTSYSDVPVSEAIAAAAAGKAFNDAWSARDSARGSYYGELDSYAVTWGFSSRGAAEADFNAVQSQYLVQGSDGYWTVNWNSPATASMPALISDIKGKMAIYTLLYEALRDLRGLVEKELEGTEEAGYKGMSINKIALKQIQKIEGSFQTIISNVLSAVQSLNQSQEYDAMTTAQQSANEDIGDIEDEDVGMFETDTRGRRATQRQNQMLREQNVARQRAQNAADANAAAARNFLSNSGITSAGGSIDNMIGSLHNAVNNVVNNIGNMSRATTDTTDDSQYTEMDYDQTAALRGQISGAISMRRVFFNAMATAAGMRNLAHQEMTGIGGRESRMDIAESINESEGKQALLWFDSLESFTEQSVSIHNDIRATELDIAENDELIAEMIDQESNSDLGGIFSILSTIVGIAASLMVLIPGLGTIVGAVVIAVCAAVAIVCAIVSSVLQSYAQSQVAEKRYDLEKKYAAWDMKPSDQTYNPERSNIVTGDSIIDTMIGAEDANQTEIGDMTTSNYLSTLDNGWHSGITGSSVFDTVSLASAYQRMNANNIIMLMAEAARQTMIEMRNLSHQEMTGIGGRGGSNMTTAAIEAVKGTQSALSGYQYSNISNQNEARNRAYERGRNISLYRDYMNAAKNGLYLSWIPIVGGVASSTMTNQTDNYANRDQADETAHDSNGNDIDFTTTASLEDSRMNDLIADGMINTGGSNEGVSSAAIADLRKQITREFIGSSVENSIKRTLSQIRSLVHMEMTGIRSATSGDFADQAMAMDFQTALESLNMINTYLTQRAQIHNQVIEAHDTINQLNDQIATEWVGMSVAIIAAVIMAIVMGPGAGIQGVLSMLQSAGTIMGLVMQIVNTITSWMTANDARNKANEGTGDVMTYIRMREAQDNSANSNTSRLEQLEDQCVDEITERLMQSTGSGHVGVNRGLAAGYKDFINRLVRAEKTKMSMQETLQELRSIAHEAMTGIGGVTSNVAESVVSMNQQTVEANIDSMFDLLETAAQRWNQLTDARQQAVRAEMEAIRKTISASIQVIITVISMMSSASAKQKAMADAKNGLNNAQNALDSAKASGAEPAEVQKLQTAADTAKIKYETAVRSYNDVVKRDKAVIMGLQVADIVSQIAMNAVEKSALKENAQKSEGKVAAAGISAGPAASTVMANNQVQGGDWSTIAANKEAETGQNKLNAEVDKHKGELKSIDKQARNKTNQVLRDAFINKTADFLKDIAVLTSNDTFQRAGITERSDQEKLMNEIIKEKSMAIDSDMQKAILNITQNQPVTKAMMTTILQTAEQLTKSGGNLAALSQIASQVSKSNETFRPTEAPAKNTKALADRLDQLMKPKGTEASPSVPQLEGEITQLEKNLEKPNLQDVRERLMRQLEEKKLQLKGMKEEVVRLKTQLEGVKGNLGVLEKAWETQKRGLNAEIGKLLARIEELKKLKATATGKNVETVDKEIARVTNDIAGLAAKSELTRAEYEIGQGGMGLAGAELKSAEEATGKINGEINEIKGLIGQVNKEIVREGKPHVNAVTPMTK